MTTYEYNGPVYMWGTNTEVFHPKGTRKLLESDERIKEREELNRQRA